MGLILPKAPDWTYTLNNFPDARGANVPTATGYGTGFTAGANNTKGSTVALLGPFTYSIERLLIRVSNINDSGESSLALADIMIDYAGGTSWNSEPLIPNLPVGGTRLPSILTSTVASSSFAIFDIPVFVPAGASIGIRAQTARTSDITGAECIVVAYGGNANPGSYWCAYAFEQVGINASTSGLAPVTPGDSSSWGSWTNVGSALAFPCKALFGVVGGENDTAWFNATYELQFGVNSSPIGDTLLFGCVTSEYYITLFSTVAFIPRAFPAGTQMQARIRGHTTGSQNQNVGFLALR